jgi:hypothetical protein
MRSALKFETILSSDSVRGRKNIVEEKNIVSMLLLYLLGPFMGYQASTNYSFH